MLNTKDVNFDGSTSYSFDAPLGTNNVATIDYRMSISAKVNGKRYEWFWRGSPAGSTYSATAAPHQRQPDQGRQRPIPLQFGTISGSVNGPVPRRRRSGSSAPRP